MTGDIGEFWNDVRAARKAAGFPALRRVKPSAVRPTRKEAAAFLKHGLEPRSEWHWPIRLAGGLLDYWPSKSHWRYLDTRHQGDVSMLLAFVDHHKPERPT
jgi:hypothetical protein